MADTLLPPAPLPVEALYRASDLSALDFETTADLPPVDGPVGQARALEALTLAVGIDRPGYNVFAFGTPGSGRHSIVKHILTECAAERPCPQDWCYVADFEAPSAARALSLPAGRGRELEASSRRLIDELESVIPAAFASDEYKARVAEIESEVERLHAEALEAIKSEAEALGLVFVRTPVGFAFVVQRDGKVVAPDDYDKLPEKDRAVFDKAIDTMQTRLQEVLAMAPKWREEGREKLRTLNEEVANFEVGHLIGAIKADFDDLPDVIDYLDAVQRDVVAKVDTFRAERPTAPAQLLQPDNDIAVRKRYAVNVLVDHHGQPHAPVVYEDLPTLAQLLGRVEHVSRFGALVTDFTHIRAGALHRANGGYLIIDARKLLAEPYAWDGLKRALNAGEIKIVSLSQRLSLISTVSLDPAPIPLDVKVVLVGEPLIYYLLCHLDPEFSRHFKVAADFADRVERTQETMAGIARLIATQAKGRSLRPLSRGAVARVIERAARDVGDAGRLSTNLERLIELLEESDYQAGCQDAEVIQAEHVDAAVQARVRRISRPRDRLFEAIADGVLKIDTSGSVIGQIHGLAVMRAGEFTFGRPSRISATCRIGRGKVVDIERETELGGELHSKGVLILQSFLGRRYAPEHALALQASLVFEQSYGKIDGDSASLAELCALLSAIAKVPIRQSIAVTGSIDQAGTVQAIGGVNEKIEGFFRVCQQRDDDIPCGVIIPASNTRHLMLDAEVVEAVAEGRFRIWAVHDVDQAIALLTGLEAGARDADGQFADGTFNRAVEDRLIALAERRRSWAKPPEQEA